MRKHDSYYVKLLNVIQALHTIDMLVCTVLSSCIDMCAYVCVFLFALILFPLFSLSCRLLSMRVRFGKKEQRNSKIIVRRCNW